jgi:threonine synthase
VGTGNLIAAVRKGFKEIMAAGSRFCPPRIDGVQLASVAPLPEQVMDNAVRPTRTSVAGGINVPSSVMKRAALEAIIGSGGTLFQVADNAIISAQEHLVENEGIDAEATGAVCLAAYQKGIEAGRISPAEKVVIIVTGGQRRGDLLRDNVAA